jgi:pimeloyl-ACP methyl ester carboxylesterase
MLKPVQKSIIVRGLKTAWIGAGQKNHDILLFLHGFPDDAQVWSEQIKYFQKKYLVIAPMMRGVNGSEATCNRSRYGLDAGTLDTLSILRHLDPDGEKNIRVVGHDLGSMYAWHLAPLLGKRLKGMVIINGGHPLQAWERKTNIRQLLKSWYVALFLVPVVPELILKTFGKKLLARIQKNNGVPEVKWEDAAATLAFTPNTVKHYRGIAASFSAYVLRKDGFKLEAPLLHISSDHDAFVEPANLSELEKLAKHPTVRVIPGKHWIQWEQPERINKLLEKFFAQETPSCP